jgi:hypothetical protein
MNGILKSIFARRKNLELESNWPRQIFGYPGEMNSLDWSGPASTPTGDSDVRILYPRDRSNSSSSVRSWR